MILGAQMYTVREFTKTPEALSQTLKKIADIGYKTVQVSGTCEYDPEWLSEELKKNGLECVITHYPFDKIKDAPEETVKAHKIFGCHRIGIGSMPGGIAQTLSEYEKFREDYLPAAKRIKDAGGYLMYHNHSGEFCRLENGKTVLENMLEDFSADILGITLDTYWVQSGGGDVIWWLKNLSGRVPCIHLKDMGIENTWDQKMRAVGEGNMNFPGIIKAAEEAGTEYLLVEQDDCGKDDPFDCLKRSYQYLCSLGLK